MSDIESQLSVEQIISSNGHRPILDLERHRWSDQGVAHWMLDSYGENMLYVDGVGWLTWCDGHWCRDGREMHKVRQFYADSIWTRQHELIVSGADLDAVNRFLRTYETNGKAKSVIEQVQKDRVVDIEQLNGDPDLLCCRNVTVNLRTGETHEHRREDLCSVQTPGDYVPWDDLPRGDRDVFTRFLTWACDSDVDLMRLCCRAAGYTLTGHTSEEVLFMLWGTTRSGKSTLTESLASVLGSGYSGVLDANVLLNMDKARGNVPDQLAKVAPCRLVNSSEPGHGTRFTEGIIKQITSGDKISAAFKFVSAFEFLPKWKVWISTNYAPGSADQAVHRRLVIIPFRHTVPKHLENPGLKAWLKDPDAGGRVLLAWAVEGARNWYADGLRYEEVQVSEEWKERYLADQDPVAAFLEQCTEPCDDKDCWPQVRDMHVMFESWFWTEGYGTRPMGLQKFNASVEERPNGYTRKKHPQTGRWVWRGAKLRSGVVPGI